VTIEKVMAVIPTQKPIASVFEQKNCSTINGKEELKKMA